jgi:hypothetical protein
MESGNCQRRRIPNVMQISCCHQQIPVARRDCVGNSTRLLSYPLDMTPAIPEWQQ